MSLLKTILDFYIRSSLHVAVCFVALIYSYHLHTTQIIESSFLLLAFSLIVVGYNFIKYFNLFHKKKQFRFKKGIFIITSIGFLTSLVLISVENLRALSVVFITGIMTLFYVIPIYNKKSLRLMSVVKLITVVLSWWIIIIVLPIYSKYSYVYVMNCMPGMSLPQEFWNTYFIKSIGLFFFVFGLCIPFEIRDLKYDDSSLKTIPQLISVRKTKILGIVLIAISLMLFNYFNRDATGTFYFIPVFIHVLTALAIYLSDKFKSDYYASFFVEAIPLLWLGLYFIF